jgi:hypothetical protein
MASIKVSHNIGRMKAKLKRQEVFIQKALRESQAAESIDTVNDLKANTPKLTGKTREAWNRQSFRGEGGRFGFGWEIFNKSPALKYLEDGTKSHGPVTAQSLYIPLRISARKGYKKGMTYGKDYILKKRVAGIKAHNIVKNQLPITQRNMYNRWRRVLRAASKR